jgi:hypothetical protein
MTLKTFPIVHDDLCYPLLVNKNIREGVLDQFEHGAFGDEFVVNVDFDSLEDFFVDFLWVEIVDLKLIIVDFDALHGEHGRQSSRRLFVATGGISLMC